ncbi:hypothetical protein SNOG_01588 [Parastagonospora nodorum SN15]|uniref:Uncharacterized protein n=1 Tax=Phaeosphaeria nodorum (strain SN15 / ATCC MYA-4574 / FGSC 10173) TaxID=321614 RepID=Q0V326_PHANO|nr:hypothetical protein SNOG_01588 [Parastagonospora nodorum SN15]EAT91237.1 hypothetical protein SNOG_01588 [Parastagonospora nodorum SN15]
MASANSYFVPGFGISRTVIQNEIRYHCGPDAIVRPYTFQAQIDDLKESSREYEEKQSRISNESSVFVNAPIPINQRIRRP